MPIFKNLLKIIGAEPCLNYHLHLQFINWNHGCDEDYARALELLIANLEVDRSRICCLDAMVNWSNKKAYINIAGDVDRKYLLEIRSKIISVLEENGYKTIIDKEDFS